MRYRILTPTEPELVLDLLAFSPTWALFEQIKAEMDTKIAGSFGAVG